MQREVHIPQAMQRHTGCAWVQPVHPTCAEDKTEKPKPEAPTDGRDIEPRGKSAL